MYNRGRRAGVNSRSGTGSIPEPTIEFTQINLHHCKSASAVLARRMAKVRTGICLVQEPWLHKGRISGLNGIGTVISGGIDSTRTCLIVKGLQVESVPQHCTRDLCTAKVTYKLVGGGNRSIMVSAAYFPYEAAACPPEELVALIRGCEANGTSLIVGCDANAHHTTWGSSDCNSRGVKLLEFLVSTRMDIVNKGSKPTFQNTVREEVIDITLASRDYWATVCDWRVSDEITMSDHNYIVFRIGGHSTVSNIRRNPRRTNWVGYEEDLKARIGRFPATYGTREDIDHCCEILRDIVMSSLENNCELRKEGKTKGAPWWNSSLEKFRKKVRRLFNRSKRTKSEQDMRLFRSAQREYKREIEKAVANGWRDYCSSRKTISDTARLCSILQNPRGPMADSIKLASGNWSGNQQEALKGLLEAHFPDFREGVEAEDERLTSRGEDWRLARHIMDKNRIRWAIGTFDAFKAAGPDGIFPALLQVGANTLLSALEKLYRACLALGYVPIGWRMARVAFLPKPGKAQHTVPKDFRPINLTSFLLKTMERLIDRFIKESSLVRAPLHCKQHAYQAGKSVDTALTDAVSFIKKGMQNRGMVLSAFLDVDGAFNHTTREAIAIEMEEHTVPGTVARWIDKMLNTRTITANWGSCSITGRVRKGCPQGGVLSPTLWCLVVDSLIRLLNDAGIYAQAYADDIVILVRDDDEGTLASLMQFALGLVESWCKTVKLGVNPSKVNVMLCTNRYKTKPVAGLHLQGARLNLVKEVKYLDVILDSRLNWGKHIRTKCSKAISTFWVCRRAFGITWGLEPEKVKWLYDAIIKPRLTYGALVWWRSSELKIHIRALDRVQRMIMGGITGSMRTTPTSAMEVLMDLPPLNKVIRACACKTFCRLLESTDSGHFKDEETVVGLMPLIEVNGCDRTVERIFFTKPYEVVYPDRKEWSKGSHDLLKGSTVWFTDGSKDENGVGAGAWESGGTQEIVCSLNPYATVFQAEVRAIAEAADRLLNEGAEYRTISFCSDSRAALMALEGISVTSKEVLKCRSKLETLAIHNAVRLLWVPGHSGILGNEKADRLAGRGASGLRARQCDVAMPTCEVNRLLKDWLKKETARKWKSTKGLRQAKDLIGDTPSEEWIKSLRGLDRRKLRLVIGWLTGHWRVGYHLHKIGLIASSHCRWCEEREETTSHLLCRCPAFAGTRQRVWGRPILDVKEVRTVSLATICRVANTINKGL